MTPTEAAGMGRVFRCGDHVHHGPSGERWLVAYHDPETGDLSAAGWPDSIARASDCRMVRATSDEEHARAVGEWLRPSAPRSRRRDHVWRLYGAVLTSAQERDA